MSDDFSNEDILELLAEEDAERVDRHDGTFVPLLGDGEIQRVWRDISIDDTPALVKFLEDYTSVKNYPNKKNYVLDPMASSEVFDGRYRNAYIRPTTTGEVTTLVQILRKGFIETLVVGGQMDWSEARIETARELPAGTSTNNPGGNTTEEYIIVMFPNTSPDKRQAIQNSIEALTVSSFNPVIRGESLGTGFHRIYVTSRIEDDGSATILLLLAKPEFTLDAYESYLTKRQDDVTYFFNVPKELAQGVLTASRAKGVSARASYNTSQGLVDIIIYTHQYDVEGYVSATVFRNCDSYEVADFYWGIEDQSLYEIPSAPVGRGRTVNKSLRNNEDGSYDVTITTRYTNRREYDYDIRTASTLSRVAIKEVLGSTTASDLIDPEDGTYQGVIYKVDLNVRNDCSYDIRTIYDIAIPNSIEFARTRSALIYEDELLYANSLSVIEADSTVGTGGIYRAGNQINEDGTYSGSLIYIESQEVTADIASSRSTLENVNRILYSGSRDAIQSPDSVRGCMYQVSERINQDGSYDGDLIYSEANEDEIYLGWETQFGTAELYIYKNQHDTTRVAAVICDLGRTTSNSVQPTINRDGSYDFVISKKPFQRSGDDFDDKEFYWDMNRAEDGTLYSRIYIYNGYSAGSVIDKIQTDPSKNMPGTTIRYAGKGRWSAVKVVRI